MTKKLTEIIGELYTPKAPDEKKFVDKHVSKLFPNLFARPEYDFLFKGTNVKAIDRTADRHGYNPGDDEKVYEEVEELDEVLKVSDGAEAWIKDFVGSDDPKFKGKSKKERIDMALGAFYAAKRKNK